jgi:hypothetical protein
MAQINQLPLMSSVSSGEQLPVYSPNNGDARRVSIGTLLDYFEQTFASPSLATNVYTPGTGFNIAVPTPVEQQWILIQPTGTLAAGTVTLPLNTTTPDGSEILVTTTQIITTFTLALNGATAAFGAPTTLAANAFFRVRFVQSTNSWYRIS